MPVAFMAPSCRPRINQILMTIGGCELAHYPANLAFETWHTDNQYACKSKNCLPFFAVL